MKKDDKKSKQQIYDNIIFCHSGAARDCTGLIPKGVTDNEEYKSYEDVYNFAVPEIVKENID